VILVGVLVMSGSGCSIFLEVCDPPLVVPLKCSCGAQSLDVEGALVYFYGQVRPLCADLHWLIIHRTFVLHYAPLVITVAAYTERSEIPDTQVSVTAYTVVDGGMEQLRPRHLRQQACFRRTASTRTP
jgi:hypothetical protein